MCKVYTILSEKKFKKGEKLLDKFLKAVILELIGN